MTIQLLRRACMIALVAIFASLAFATHQVNAVDKDAAALNTKETTEGVEVKQGDTPILFYQRAPKSRDGKLARCGYIHPLYGLSGEVLTEDFPDDHLHQRGLFWAWHQLRVDDRYAGDGWALKDFTSNVLEVKTISTTADALALRAQVEWLSTVGGEQRRLLKETTEITVHSLRDQIRWIDFQIELLALVKGLSLGGSDKEPFYSGFSLRLRLPEDLRFTNRHGNVTPQLRETAEGPWMDFFGSFHPKQLEGVTALCHPTSRGFPHPWVLRAKKSMQNAAWPGRATVAISDEQPTVLRYRLVLHRDIITVATGNEWQSEYERSAASK